MSIDAITIKLAEHDEKLAHGDRRMDTFDTLIAENRAAHLANSVALQENTAYTKEIKEIVELGKGFFKVLGWIGVAAKWVASVGAAVGAIWAALHYGGK